MENLAASLAAAQAEMNNAPLNKVNPHFKSKYADLSAIRDAAIPALARQGIACVQLIETREFGPVVVTKLLKGGEEIVSECPVMVADKTKPQLFGSALTYARRYSLASIVGISADEDDDANAANDGGDVKTPKADTVAGEAWGGPLGKQKFKDALRDFDTDLRACDDLDSLTALLNVKSTIDLLNQCQRDAPDWWYGKEGSDVQGFSARIENRKNELKQKEAA